MKTTILFVLFVAVSTTGISAQANGNQADRYWQHDMHGRHAVDSVVAYRSDRRGHYADVKQRPNHAWVSKGRHRTRRHDSVNRHIALGGRISAIRITAVKRNTYIREAWVEYDNGRFERMPELEGRLSSHNPIKVRLRNRRNVRELHLKVSSRGHHRGYFDVAVRGNS